MAIYVISPLDVFVKAFNNKEEEQLLKLIQHINEKAGKVKVLSQTSVLVNCDKLAQKIRGWDSKKRNYLLELTRLLYLGAQPPWGSVYYTALWPKSTSAKAKLTFHFMLSRG